MAGSDAVGLANSIPAHVSAHALPVAAPPLQATGATCATSALVAALQRDTLAGILSRQAPDIAADTARKWCLVEAARIASCLVSHKLCPNMLAPILH
jgi:hypothetical protein